MQVRGRPFNNGLQIRQPVVRRHQRSSRLGLQLGQMWVCTIDVRWVRDNDMKALVNALKPIA